MNLIDSLSESNNCEKYGKKRNFQNKGTNPTLNRTLNKNSPHFLGNIPKFVQTARILYLSSGARSTKRKEAVSCFSVSVTSRQRLNSVLWRARKNMNQMSKITVDKYSQAKLMFAKKIPTFFLIKIKNVSFSPDEWTLTFSAPIFHKESRENSSREILKNLKTSYVRFSRGKNCLGQSCELKNAFPPTRSRGRVSWLIIVTEAR